MEDISIASIVFSQQLLSSDSESGVIDVLLVFIIHQQP
jgi:hypothetical protein